MRLPGAYWKLTGPLFANLTPIEAMRERGTLWARVVQSVAQGDVLRLVWSGTQDPAVTRIA